MGKAGEDKAIHWLHDCLGCEIQQYNFELDKMHGVDIIAIRSSGEQITIDVKNDMYIKNTKRVLFELKGKFGNIGWGLDPEHINKYVLVVDGQSDNPLPEMWIFKLEDMRDYYQKFKICLTEHGRGEHETHFVCFPLDDYARGYGYWYVAGNGAKAKFIGNRDRNFWKMN